MSQPTFGVPELLVGEPDWNAVLVRVLNNFACVTGTLHRTDSSTGLLTLVTQHGIPPHVLPMLLPRLLQRLLQLLLLLLLFLLLLQWWTTWRSPRGVLFGSPAALVPLVA